MFADATSLSQISIEDRAFLQTAHEKVLAAVALWQVHSQLLG
jgi:hypothetical protein